MAHKTGIVRVGCGLFRRIVGRKVPGMGVAAFAHIHLHGVFGIAGHPVDLNRGQSSFGSHIWVAQRTQFGGLKAVTLVTVINSVGRMAETAIKFNLDFA